MALQQQRGTPATRSSVGSVTTFSNLLRMLHSRAGDYPPAINHLRRRVLPPPPGGSLTRCHGRGRIYEVTEQWVVPTRNQKQHKCA
ncbi:MAG TPA: hypothetical protein VF006_06290 [Longimicrobium sp.]